MTTKVNTSVSTELEQEKELRYGKFIREMLHITEANYRWLRKLQEASEGEGRMPISFIYDDEYRYSGRTYADVFGIYLSCKEAQAARKRIIKEIVYVILNERINDYGEEMMHDNYARLFHALAILKLPKDTDMFPGTTTNRIYNSIYTLWKFDDGSREAGEAIEAAAWYMAEELKKRTGQNYTHDDYLILGTKC